RARGDINILHFNPDVIIENLSRFGLEQFEGRYNIGHFYWETSRATLAHRLGAGLVDEIWVSTEYCRRIFQAVTDKPVFVARVPVAEMGDLSWASLRYFGLPDRAFTFLYTFDGASRLTRKNPLAAVRAFRLAFPGRDDVQLVLKLQNTEWLTPADEKLFAELRGAARSDRRIVLVNESFSSREVHGLIASADCYVALHRSEGFGYGMAEAMKLRVPVIATGYSGNEDFTTEETAYPVRHRLVPVSAADFVYDEPGQEWAEPDVEHAAERMREVFEGRGREAKVERARELIERVYGEAAVGEVYRERIEAVRAARNTTMETARAAA
ncbi:MAG: glycosyltransferase, partial [Candidatus Eisenbacteria bacterium]|nr:glycosyltransferase [Candidatus Eisenbacteria bacterium]